MVVRFFGVEATICYYSVAQLGESGMIADIRVVTSLDAAVELGHGGELPLVSVRVEGGIAAHAPWLVLRCRENRSTLPLGSLEVGVDVVHEHGDGVRQ